MSKKYKMNNTFKILLGIYIFCLMFSLIDPNPIESIVTFTILFLILYVILYYANKEKNEAYQLGMADGKMISQEYTYIKKYHQKIYIHIIIFPFLPILGNIGYAAYIEAKNNAYNRGIRFTRNNDSKSSNIKITNRDFEYNKLLMKTKNQYQNSLYIVCGLIILSLFLVFLISTLKMSEMSVLIILVPILVVVVNFLLIMSIKSILDNKIYKYFKSDKFIKIKDNIFNIVKDCRNLNKHIAELENSFNENRKNKENYNIQVIDNSKYNMSREYYNKLNNYQKQDNVYLCSRQIVYNASNQPFKYLCKYFDLPCNENTLNFIENTYNDFSAALEGKEKLEKQYNKVISQLSKDIDNNLANNSYVHKKIEYYLQLPILNINNIKYPVFKFCYISSGGNSNIETPITLDMDVLQKFIKYLSDNIKFKKSVAGQRALMTPTLRQEIKERDNYTCKKCHNSIYKEPNLLLEIDHIIPVSKGGLTKKDNLQTLCWKCNRKKGNKLENN